MSNTVFVATVDTRYQIMAVAETYQGARRLATEKALAWLQANQVSSTLWKNATTLDVADYFGVNVTEIPIGSAVMVL